MGHSRWIAFGGICLSACSLVVDLDGLSGGRRLQDAGIDAPSVVPDADRHDTGSDTSAPSDAPCSGKKGPSAVRVGAYCIDSTEVSQLQYDEFLADKNGDTSGQPAECEWNTSYVASVRLGPQFPIAGLDWCDALAYCTWAGKRLCGRVGGGTLAATDVDNAFSAEWYRACSASGSVTYPYGTGYEAGVCNDREPDGGAAVAPSRTFARCEGGHPGLFDMVGNYWEWQSACTKAKDDAGDAKAVCMMMGGSIVTDQPTCAARFSSTRDNRSGAGSSVTDVGIRCCSD